MIRRAFPLVLGAAITLTGCGGEGAAPADENSGPALQTADFPALASGECVDVAQFYFEAIGGRDFEAAALVWNDPVVDGARLEGLFGGYDEPEITWVDPFLDDVDGSQYCSTSGVLTDASDPQMPAREGTLLLRRVSNDPGAENGEPRWTVQSSSFIEHMERSAKD